MDDRFRITSYNVCYTKLLRTVGAGAFTFLMALAMDEPLANAWAGASAVDPGFEIVSELQALLASYNFV